MCTALQRLTIIMLLGIGPAANAQTLSEANTRQIDSIFRGYQNGPGCAVGIIRNDSLVFAKGYGQANLEYNIPITASTPFHMASVSKQFTAYAMLLLQRQGKLKLEDDIRKYLPWFPDLKQRITIRQLLEHTSGIRDQFNLLAIRGTQLDDVLTQDLLLKLIGRQRSLEFVPGDKFNYSNSGYSLAAAIVEAASGQRFREFTDSAIFRPLGMMHTHFHDDYTEIIPGRAYSYDRKDNAEFALQVLSYGIVGGTGLITTVEDMQRWITNFFDPKSGDTNTIRQLITPGQLNNGKPISYALGIGAGDYRGRKLLAHGGSDAGFRTTMWVLPESRTGIIVFSNLASVNPGQHAQEIADILFPDDLSAPKAIEKILPDSSKTILGNPQYYRLFAGDYIGDNGVQCSFSIVHNKLYWHSFGENHLLQETAPAQFRSTLKPQTSFIVNKPSGRDTIIRKFTDGEERIFTKVKLQNNYTDAALKTYTGSYYSEELDCHYDIVLKDHQLVLQHIRYADTPLRLIGQDHLLNDQWFIGHIVLLRDQKNTITGFMINNNRTKQVRFRKMN